MCGRRLRSFAWSAAVIGLIVTTGAAYAQEPKAAEVLGIPQDATLLEGLPDVRVEVTDQAVTRRLVAPEEAQKERLRVRVKDGNLFSDDGPLTISESGGFTYLSSTQPGRYVRLRRLNDRLLYAEHIDMGERSVTYWGELQVVIGR